MSTNVKTKKSQNNVWGAILIVLLLLIAFCLIHTVRNFIIISKLQKEVEQYTNSTNWHLKSVANEKDGTTVTINYYKKDNKQAVRLEKTKDNSTTIMLMYNNGNRTDTFIQNGDSKIAKLNNGEISVQVNNYLQTNNSWQTFSLSFLAHLKSTEQNGKKCYILSNIYSPYFLTGSGKDKAYIEKDTGLCVKEIMDEITSEREYEFNNVNDSIFTEPDIGQYTIQN